MKVYSALLACMLRVAISLVIQLRWEFEYEIVMFVAFYNTWGGYIG